MNKRVYGIIGVSSILSNWNADFTGRPKSLSDGQIFGSDKALKYSMKNYWRLNGEKLLFIKTHKTGKDGKMQPKQLEERYNEIFDTTLDVKTSSSVVLNNLFSALDVMNFGATFAVKKQNIGITGVVQIGQGLNLYDDTAVETQDILSPFQNSNKEDADQSTLGTKVITNEAHYFYPFSVNPSNLDNYIGLAEDFNGYREEAYKKFKEAALNGATALNTNSKNGCQNEFSLFVTLKENSRRYVPQLTEWITFSKESGKNVIDLTHVFEYLSDLETEIESVEVYYNPVTTEIKGQLSFAQFLNLYTEAVVQ